MTEIYKLHPNLAAALKWNPHVLPDKRQITDAHCPLCNKNLKRTKRLHKCETMNYRTYYETEHCFIATQAYKTEIISKNHYAYYLAQLCMSIDEYFIKIDYNEELTFVERETDTNPIVIYEIINIEDFNKENLDLFFLFS